MPDIDRRNLIAGAAIVAGATLAPTQAPAQAACSSPPKRAYAPRPLAFNAASTTGFSGCILTSHHDNNYVGAVTRLGALQAQLAQRDVATSPGFQISGLKREELLATSSMFLHESYLASLGVGGSAPGKALGHQMAIDFGSYDGWRREFVGMGRALGGGSASVLLSWSPRRGLLSNQWAYDHTMTIADGRPLVALDKYEHAYHIDFGAKAGDYVNAYRGALNWANADHLFARKA